MTTTETRKRANGRKAGSKWAPIKRGRTTPEVVAWIEVFWCQSLGGYVAIPGASRFHDGAERPE